MLWNTQVAHEPYRTNNLIPEMFHRLELILTLLYNTIKYTINLTITVKTHTRNTTNTKCKSKGLCYYTEGKRGGRNAKAQSCPKC